MVKVISIRGKRYVVSESNKVMFTAREWNIAAERFRREAGKRLADRI